MLNAALDAAITSVPRLLMADWMTMLANENTALCTPAGRPMLRMRLRLVRSMRSAQRSTRTHLFVRVRRR